ncbi:hypothetical protein BGZ92_006282, partial [Podila epicladia]
STRGSVSAFIDGKTMYVHGGFTNSNQITAQSFSLDLSTSWDVTAPAYEKLPDGVRNANNPGALLNDSATLFILADWNYYYYYYYYYYNVLTGQLTGYNVDTNIFNATHSGHAASMHPETGQVYMPYGYYGPLDNGCSLL